VFDNHERIPNLGRFVLASGDNLVGGGIIFGAVYNDDIGDDLKVTVVATGLGQARVQAQTKPQLVMAQKTGTDNMPATGAPNYKDLDMPTVFRNNRAGTLEALQQSGMETLDIPAFLRKQAD
jgi:cell division protein FtsZ